MDLQQILADHKEWLADNTKGKRANLRGADLCGANLHGANLREANLREANLRNANLRGADLYGADLRDATGNNAEVKSLQTGVYLVSYTKDMLNIGCQTHPITDWWNFTDKEILAMDGKKALKFWRTWKPLLQQIIAETN